MDFNSYDIRLPPRQNFQLRHESGKNIVTQEICEPLLGIQRLCDPTYIACPIFDADQQRTARGVGERDDGAQCALGR
jgi:hypothetical protein